MSHLDLYRLPELAETDWADLEPYFEDAVALVEWPEPGKGFLPSPRAAVRLRVTGPANRVVVVESSDKSLENALSPAPC